MVHRRLVAGLAVIMGAALLITTNTKAEETAMPKNESKPTQSSTPAPKKAAKKAKVGKKAKAAGKLVTTSTGLQYEVLKEGTGAVAKAGQTVSVHYTGWLTNGTKFDSSVDRGQPFQFNLGAGQVIKGWDEGVAGMKIGEKRKLTIPSFLGYGANGAGAVIPPNATLVFDVELLGVQ